MRARSPSATELEGRGDAIFNGSIAHAKSPFATPGPRSHSPDARSRFNRSSARSSFVTRRITPALCPGAEFQSLKREKPFCNGRLRGGDGVEAARFNRSSARSSFVTSCASLCCAGSPTSVSIAQARKVLLQLYLPHVGEFSLLGFNRSSAKSPFATCPVFPCTYCAGC